MKTDILYFIFFIMTNISISFLKSEDIDKKNKIILGKHSNEITIIYHSEDPIGKEILAYIQGSSMKIS